MEYKIMQTSRSTARVTASAMRGRRLDYSRTTVLDRTFQSMDAAREWIMRYGERPVAYSIVQVMQDIKIVNNLIIKEKANETTTKDTNLPSQQSECKCTGARTCYECVCAKSGH